MNGNIRDFHDKNLTVYFPKKLCQKVESVELIVNGWIILNEKFNDVDWRIEEFPWLYLVDKELKMYRSINKGTHDQPPYSQWTINLYDKLPDYDKDWSTTSWFGDIVDGLNMLQR